MVFADEVMGKAFGPICVWFQVPGLARVHDGSFQLLSDSQGIFSVYVCQNVTYVEVASDSHAARICPNVSYRTINSYW